jgi:hypothetical protein
LQEAGCAQRRLTDQEARTQANAAREFVRLAGERGAQLELRIAYCYAVADFQAEPRQ